MTNEVKNVPEMRFPSFSGEWEEKRLGEVTIYKNGGSFENSVKNHGIFKLITLKSVNTEGELINSGKYIDDKSTETLCKGTLVMILSEQAPGLVGMTANITRNNKYVLNQRVAALVPKQGIDSQFLSKLINRNQKYFSVRSAGTKVKNISKGHVENFNFLSPNYTEQQKIGSFFSKLDRQIELEEQKLEKLEKQKKGYMQKIFSQELRFKDKNGNEFPKWEEGTIKSLVHGNISDGNWIEKEHISKTGKYRIIQTGNIGIGKYLNKENNSKFINQKDYDELKANEIYSGDILISRLAAPAGRSMIMPDINWRMVTSVDVAIIRPNKLFDPYFLISMLNTDKKLYDISKFVSGSSHKRISRKNLEKIKVISPEIREQQKIGDFFRKIDELIEKQSEKIEVLKMRKKGFLQKMFV